MAGKIVDVGYNKISLAIDYNKCGYGEENCACKDFFIYHYPRYFRIQCLRCGEVYNYDNIPKARLMYTICEETMQFIRSIGDYD